MNCNFTIRWLLALRRSYLKFLLKDKETRRSDSSDLHWVPQSNGWL